MRFVFVLLVVLILLQSSPVIAEDIDDLIAPRVEHVIRLYGKHVSVSHVIYDIDRAIKLWESGDRVEALNVLENVDLELSRLEAGARYAMLVYYVKLGLSLAILISAPIIFYLFLPRVYLMLWFKLRRGWVVKIASR